MTQITLSTSGTPYLIINNMSGQFYNNTTSAFEVYSDLNWEDYALSGAQVGSSQIWHFEFPSAIGTGTYDVIGLLRGGATPAETDTGIANGTFYWNATAAVLLPQEPSGAELIYDAVYVNHNYGGSENLQILDDDGNPEENVVIRAYTKDNYDTGNRELAFVAAEDTTDTSGYWRRGIYLEPNTYILVFIKTGFYVKTREITIS